MGNLFDSLLSSESKFYNFIFFMIGLIVFLLLYLLTILNRNRYSYLCRQLLIRSHPKRISFPYTFVPKYAHSGEHTLITAKPTVDFTIAFCMRRNSKALSGLVQKINEFMLNCIDSVGLSTYEILLITDSRKNDEVDELEQIYKQYDRLLIFESSLKDPWTALLSGILHCNGRYIFSFFPFQALSLTDLTKMFEKLQTMLSQSNDRRAIVWGLWPTTDSSYKYVNTNLGKFITWACNKIYKLHNLDTTALSRSRCQLMTREAALDIIPNVVTDFAADCEMLIISGELEVPCSYFHNTLVLEERANFKSIYRVGELMILLILEVLDLAGFYNINHYYFQNYAARSIL
nr:dolichyl-phosphate mannose synthase [Trichomonas vaginalis]